MKFFAATVLASLLAVSLATSESWVSRAGKFHGDIALTAHQERTIYNATGIERNAIRDLSDRWSNGRVPYDLGSTFSSNEKEVIRQAIADYSANTCLEFVERNGESDYVEFVKEGGCWSYVGRIGGKQKVSLDNGCVYKYIVIHELMHAVGFFHEQSRYDRDGEVTVNTGNICCNAESNFDKLSSSYIQLLDEPYDKKSVMHYDEYAFSRNGQKTIEAVDGTSPLGNENGFTQIDINKVNKLYECSTTGTTTTGPITTDSTMGPETTTVSSCTDMFGRMCERWASRGHCTSRSHGSFMMNACPESCDNCDGSAGQCVDKYRKCRGLARSRRDYCNHETIGDWMYENCPDSCNFCE